MPGKLSTHVLDLSAGHPAAGMKIELWRRDEPVRLIATVTTNADGRTDAPLLAAAAMVTGHYELIFFVGDYFASRHVACTFLDRVPVAFAITESDSGYHVPLLVTPWAYQTYRGS
jgi:5-hydroxyisourate hydrolase